MFPDFYIRFYTDNNPCILLNGTKLYRKVKVTLIQEPLLQRSLSLAKCVKVQL